MSTPSIVVPIDFSDCSGKEVQKATELGTWLPNFEITFTALTSDSIPFIRICEAGYVDTRGERVVGLTVD